MDGSFEKLCKLQAPRKMFALPGSKPHYPRDRVYDAKHVRLEIELDFDNKRLIGKAYHTISSLINGLQTIELDAVDLTIKRVFHNSIDLEYDVYDGKLSIKLDKPLKLNEEIKLGIEYEVKNPKKGLYFISPDDAYPDKPVQAWTQGEDEDNRYWFPCYDFPNDRLTSELLVTVPKKFTVVSNGRLLKVTEQDGKKTYHWLQDKPHVSYLISLVAGEYVEIKDEVDGIPVLYYVYPGREEDAKRSFSSTPQMVKFYSDMIGTRYPWDKYSQAVVADFIYGGMENTSATTLTDSTLHDERAHIDYSSEPLVAHELAHQWFGDLITCKDWAHAWLNEGFATYFQSLYVEHSKGREEFLYDLFVKSEDYFKEESERYRRPIVTRVYHEPTELFDRHLYQKAALVLHMLRFVLGEELFWRAIRHYVSKHAFSNVDTEDFRKAFEEATGKSLELFIEQWFYKPGHPEFNVSYEWEDSSMVAKLRVIQTQQEPDTFVVPVEVKFVTKSGEKVFRVNITDKDQTFYFPLDSKPLWVSFDPDNNLLKKVEFDKPKEMLIRQLKEGSVMERVYAARSLTKYADEQTVEALGEALHKDGFWGVQAEAAKALGKIKTSHSLKKLIEGLKVKHAKTRRAVVKALGEFRGEEAGLALRGILVEGDESYYVEAEAARSLGRTKASMAFETLIGALKKDSHNDVIRTSVFEGLAELGDERAVPIAKEWASYGKHPRTRAAAASCLGKVGKGKRDVFDYLISLLDDSWYGVRVAAVEALEELRDEKAIPELERRLAVELNNRVKRKIREALIKLKEERPEEMSKIREEIESLRSENRKLRERIDMLESIIRSKLSS